MKPKSFESKFGYRRIEYNQEDESGRITEEVIKEAPEIKQINFKKRKELLDKLDQASPIQGVVQNIISEIQETDEAFINLRIMEVGVDPDALIRTGKLNRALQDQLKISEMMHKNVVSAVLEIASRYGQIDGAHHKAWVIDQMVRKLLQTEKAYHDFVYDYEEGGEYTWDEGIAP